ncbi:MAG: MG2 domain-containing protein [Chloroflexota bacterium]
MFSTSLRTIQWRAATQATIVRAIAILVILLSLQPTVNWAAQAQSSWPVHFGAYGPVQFVDPDGLNQIYFQYRGDSSTNPLTFKLYQVDAARFAQLNETLDSQSVPDTTGLTEAASWNSDAINRDYYAIQATTVPEVTSGTYLLISTEAGTGQQNAALIVVSRAALVLKMDASGGLTAWASTLRSGAPIAGMSVAVYDKDGNAIGSGTTNSDGIALIATGVSLNAQGNPVEELIAVASGDSEMTVAGTGIAWRNYNYYGGSPSTYSAYLYTERPLYKPGDEIQFKMILRQASGGSYTVPTDETVRMKLEDSRGDEADSMELSTDEFGSINGQFTLGEGVPLGSYKLFATVGPEGATQTFQQELKVEEYRKPEYSVTVSGSESYGISGQPMDIQVEARYFFDEAVADADVTIQILKNEYRWYRSWWDWGFYDYIPPSDETVVAEHSGKTDENGLFVQSFTPENSADYTTRYRVKATVTDAQGQPIDGSFSLKTYWNDAAMRVWTSKYGYQTGEAIQINGIVSRHDGTPVADQSVQIVISGDTWDGGSTTFPDIVRDVTTDAEGNIQTTLNNLPQGWYKVKASMTDGIGRDLVRSDYFWVFRPRLNDNWWYFNSADLTIIRDKNSYEVGDTAKLLIESRITDTYALLTLEREEVLEERVIKLEGAATSVEIPITETFAPNVVAQVHLYKPTDTSRVNPNDLLYYAPSEAQLVVARTELVVPVTNKRLDIDIETDADEYLPGDQATITLQVTDSDGQPVRAQVSLALVDEALLALQADLSGDLFETMHGRRKSSIATFQSTIQPEFYSFGPEPALEMAPPAADEDVADDNASRDDQSTADIALRKEFLDTAYWNPSIITDDTGNATITIDLPDNLTTWRIIAKAVTVETQVGEGAGSLLVKQELIAQPALPRFSVLGDRFRVGGVGRNFSGADLDGTIDMSCSNLLLLDEGTRNLTLPNNGSSVEYWTAVASQIGMGTVTTSLLAGESGDRIELPLEVKPFAIPDRQAFSAVVTALQPSAEEKFEVPLNAINESSSLTIQLSPSLALSLLDDLSSLINYPYGCVEQTMSRLMPSAAASIVYKELGITNPKEAELDDIMAKGINRLKELQNSGGGWTWYGAGEVDEHISAYVMLGLTLVQEAGFEVPESVTSKGFSYLSKVLTEVEDQNVRTYILYVQSRAGQSNLQALQALVSGANGLDSFSLGVLAQSLYKEGDTESANAVVDLILSRVRETASGAYLPADSSFDWYHWKTMASDEKNTAAAISALSALRPEHPTLPKMVRWLLNQRQGSNYYTGAGWQDTHATASAVLGLLDYIQVSREFEANYSYSVLLNGSEVGNGQITPENFTQPIDPLAIPGDLLRFGENELVISRTEGNGSLYATGAVRLQLYFDQFEEVTEEAQGLDVTRSYYKAGTRTLANLENLQVGALIDVEVVVGNESDMSYVLVSSPIPAGVEVVDDGVGTSPYRYDDWRWYDYSYSYKDLRADRVDFFSPQLYRGNHVYRYQLRALTPGEFSALPAEAYPMYKDELWGRSASEQFLISSDLLVERPVLTGDFDNDCRISQFDAQQVAAAWGTNNAQANVSGGGERIDLRDVAQVAGRIGANCLVDAPAPGVSGEQASLTIQLNQTEAGVAQSFTADIVIAQGSNLSGLELTLDYDPLALRFDSVEWNGEFRNALPFEPTVDTETGQIRFGAYDTNVDGVSGASAGTKVATVVFRGLRSGEANLQLQTAQATNGNAQMVQTSITDGDGQITLDGATVFVPVVSH